MADTRGMNRLADIFFSGETGLGRSLLAFLIAPPVASFALAAFWMASLSGPDPVDPGLGLLEILFAAALATALAGALVAYVGMMLVGLPAWLVLRLAGLEGALSYGLAGALGGAMLGPQVIVPPVLAGGPQANGAVAGLIMMLLFWWMARRHS